jgi:ABC-type Fe3+-hydroxamate transport system substrate-binding protein
MFKTLSRFTLAVAVLALFTLRGLAAEQKGKGDKPKFFNELTAVDSTGNTVTVYHNPSKSVTYTVTEGTKITVDHKPGKIGDLKEGMKVTVSHKGESNEADSIMAESVKGAKGGTAGGHAAPPPAHKK